MENNPEIEEKQVKRFRLKAYWCEITSANKYLFQHKKSKGFV